MVVYLQSLQILSDLMLKVYLKICLKDTPVSAYTVHSIGMGLMSLKSVVILSHKIYWQGSIVYVVLLYADYNVIRSITDRINNTKLGH